MAYPCTENLSEDNRIGAPKIPSIRDEPRFVPESLLDDALLMSGNGFLIAIGLKYTWLDLINL